MPPRPWLVHYDAGVPRSLEPYPPKTLLGLIDDILREAPGHTAYLFKGTRLTWARVDALANAFAAALGSLGVRPGDRVALLLPNAPQFIVALLGTWKAGGVVVALNPTYTERELERPLAATGAPVAVVLTRAYDKLTRVQPRTSLRTIIATNIKEYLPAHLRILYTMFREAKEGDRVRLAAGDVWFQDVLRAHRGATRPAVDVGPDDPAIILQSGGTTGMPKGVLGLHRHYVEAGLQLRAWTAPAREDWRDVIMLPLPLFHVYANVGALSMAIAGRNPVALIPNPRDIDDLLKAIHTERPAFLAAVPTLFTAMLNHRDVQAGRADFRSIKLCFSGAAALLAETKRRFESLTGGRIIEGYSLTEAMMAVCANPVQGPNKIGSVGMPLPDVEVRIVDADAGERELAQGEVGEIILRAPQLMAGYWQDPAETAATLRVHGEGEPWVHTGDLGYLDEDGYLFVVDRKKDCVKTSGFQVWPREVEEVIATHPAVMEVGVAGVPDPVKGEAVRAWIVLKPGAAATGEEIRAFCRERLAPYKVPSAVEFRQELPKTMVGKVLRRALAAEAKDQAG